MTFRGTQRLPETLTRFLGRDNECAEVEAAVANARLVTLTGAPGCGKTRLAIEVGSHLVDRFGDGVALVELAAVSDPARVANAVAVALVIGEQPGYPIEQTLIEELSDQKLLLIVDNCEHVAAAVATFTRRVVEECPAVSVLATSRVALGVAGEQVWQVPPLEARAALDLFVDRARLVRVDFGADDGDREVLAEICVRLDGLPLAIELAAPWTRVLSPGQLRDRLNSALPLLSAGGQVTTDRQQTMAATVEWSYRLLGPDNQQLFDRLSVFAGSFDLDAAEVVGGSDGDVLVGLTSLVDHSLVVTEPAAGESMRYRLLEPIRQSAQAGLIAGGEAAIVRRRHAEHYLQVASRCDRDLRAGRRQEALLILERDEPNLLAALDWARIERSDLGLRLAAALAFFWDVRGRVNAGRAWLEDMLTIDTTDPRLRSSALARAALLAWRQRDYSSARTMTQESLEIERELGDELGAARRLRGLGLVTMIDGDAAVAVHQCEQAITVFRTYGDDHGLVWALMFRGLADLIGGDPAGADAPLREALIVNSRVGSLVATVLGELYLSRAAHMVADVVAERGHLTSSLAAMREMGGIVHEPDWVWAACGLAMAEGRTRTALRLAGAAEALSRRSGSYLPSQYLFDLHPLLDRARQEIGAVIADRLATEGTQLSVEELSAEAIAETDDPDDDPLTRREREVADLVAAGLSNPEIGRRLFISRRTVETHVDHIKQKLGLDTRTRIIASVLGATVESQDP